MRRNRQHEQKVFVFIDNRVLCTYKSLKVLSIETATMRTNCTPTPARELGVEWGWVSNRIRNGFLREPDISRQPPYGNYLIRDDAALRARLRAEVKRSRRVRRNAFTEPIPPDVGESLKHLVEGESRVAGRAMTSRTNRISKDANSDA